MPSRIRRTGHFAGAAITRDDLSEGDAALLAWHHASVVVVVANAVPEPFVAAAARHALTHAADWADGAEMVTRCSVESCPMAQRWLRLPLTDADATA